MSRFIAYVIRFAVILVGYIAASLAASAFLNILFLGSLGYTPDQTHPTAAASLYFSIPFVALFVAYFAFMPAAVVIVAAEILGRRDWLFYAIAGGGVAAAFLGFVRQSGDPDFVVADTSAILAVIGSGMVGGIFYWLAAGRWAGSWRETQPISPGPSGS
ncbi:hypothetical protein [Mesorhizobium sp.]|uniref:hypothetical protein n=1 Tax=Mesorhizobium sp. TaxID=1871066 RepID=UPI000FD2D2CC|nr:hypothetical protein [Mesorhizobium sp.]RVC57826.1 hypothetical protein EN779_20705 [Mesorhizobium sp. M4B.F.Ca.ET.088.02.2.1]RWF27623.1 MAG: hypothetical protein EOS45_25390 [Mesorhizobium sp.]TJW01595.1 MAG: hypothetical protein E5W97_25540 [Mesorhizobium sp.]